ncbi:3-deoxy-D-manno-octulosonate 8-phosphate phosphatase [Haemophilus influenzae]|uniref:3-deoxy-D-manno-octulosonate 8-phosphate phosphatase n=1 Tax=Haemophilus influenzae TaxID=727 RepID=A0A2X1Q1I5_HAEIF|nr:3-deoxy-D-manno-octulosonate 8-phosphate phosphatase [Haemophilus influenzae]
MQQKLENIKFVITDVDGVLTDGQLHYDANGEAIKSFHVRDGLGIKMLMDAGIQVASAFWSRLPYFTSSHCRSWY